MSALYYHTIECTSTTFSMVMTESNERKQNLHTTVQHYVGKQKMFSTRAAKILKFRLWAPINQPAHHALHRAASHDLLA